MGGLFYFKVMNLLVTALGVLLISITSTYKAKIEHPFSKPIMIPPEQLEHFTFGHPDLIADLLWIRAVQSMDYCGSTFTTDEPVALGNNARICEKGWLFHMLDAATRVAPRYRVIYSRGAVNLSVVVNDFQGAGVIFKRGTEVFPEDWVIYYNAGYHELFDMNNPHGAAEYMRLAGVYGAPNWATLLAAKLFDQAGQAEFGLQALGKFYGQEPFAEWPVRARERWVELEKKLGHKVAPPEPMKSFER